MTYYYVYRITCDHPDSAEKYYYGVRKSPVQPVFDTQYWSSSVVVRHARQRYGADWFRKKILRTYATYDQALRYEIFLHAYFNVKQHPLFFNQANQTSARFTLAEGPLTPAYRAALSQALRGRVVSAATREKLAASKRGTTLPAAHKAKIKATLTGRLFSETHRANLAAANRRRAANEAPRTVSEATKAKISASLQGRVVTPETRAKIRQAHVGKSKSTAQKAAQSATQKARYAALSPEERQALQGRPISEAHKERLRVVNTGKVVSPETKAKIAASMRASWAKRRGDLAPGPTSTDPPEDSGVGSFFSNKTI